MFFKLKSFASVFVTHLHQSFVKLSQVLWLVAPVVQMRYSVDRGQDLLTEDNWTEYSIVIGGVLDQISMSSLYFHVLRSTFILMINYYRMELMMTCVWVSV